MKKLISILLTVCLLASALCLMASCAHKCKFGTEWTTDASAHWHICEDGECELTADHGAHTFDEGKITTVATQEADGVKTYTCSVCAYARTETVLYTGMTEAEWTAAFAVENFKNFTYTEVTKGSASGFEVTTTVGYKMTEEKVLASIELMGQTQEQTLTGDDVTIALNELWKQFETLFSYSEYTYDAATKSYTLTGNASIVSSGAEIALESATLKMEGGKPASFTYTATQVESGVSVAITSTITFSDYGTTVVE